MRYFKRTLVIQFILLLFFLLIVGQTLQASTHVILQGFNWESYQYNNGSNHYREMLNKVQEIETAGFNAVWFPPASYAYDGEGLYPHSRGYIPMGYMNLNSTYGSEAELKQVVQEFKKRNIISIADLVFNHRGVSYYEPGHQGDNNYARFTDFDWGLWAFTSGQGQNGHGSRDTGADFTYAFDIDITNKTVRNDFLKLLNKLENEIGFQGWRFDYVKGYTPEFIAYLNKNSNPMISIGEYWDDMNYCANSSPCYDQNSHRQQLTNWIDGTWKNHGLKAKQAALTFDFTTKGILQHAIRTNEFWRLRDQNNKAPGLIGWWSEKAVTFIDNHDTGSTQGHWPFGNREQVLQGYAYILTHPGIPTVFWDHYFSWNLKQEIEDLIKIRQKYGINSNSKIRIIEAKQDLYVAEIDRKIILKLGPGHWSATPEWTQAQKRHNFVIYLK